MKLPFVRTNIIKSLVIKEFKQVFRDRRMRLMIFGSPLLMLLVFGYAVNTDVTTITTGLLDEDRSSLSREFERKFFSSGYFVPSMYIGSPAEGGRLLDKGLINMYMHIPRGFSSRVKSGKGAEVQIILDGTDSSRASVINAYINLITSEFTINHMTEKIRAIILSREWSSVMMKQSVEIKERTVFNPELISRNFFLPGVLVLLLALITIMLTSMSVVKERENGTIEQIIVSPLKPAEFIAGKTLPFVAVGIIEIILITLITIAWFRVPFNGSFLFLLTASMCYILCTLAIGLYISTISGTQQQAMLSTFIFFIPAIMLSGFVFPIYAMPEIFRFITLANPMRHFIAIVRGIFLKGAGFTVLWEEVLALIIIGTLLFSLSIRRISRRFE
jgi:ABC-2 type transport system permease protein